MTAPKPPVQAPRALARTRRGPKELLALFIEDKSDLTLRNYRGDLLDFAQFLGVQDIEAAVQQLVEMDSPDAHATAIRYKGYMRRAPIYRSVQARERGEAPLRHGYSSATVNRRLTALRSVMRLARILGLVDYQLEIPGEVAESLRDTAGCGPQGYRTLLEHIETRIETAPPHKCWVLTRNLAIVRLLHDSGLRRKEVLTIQYPDDVDLKRRRVRILGKKRREREWVPISTPCAEAFDAWLDQRGREPGAAFLSFTRVGRPLGLTGVNQILDRLSKETGVDVTPHKLRHTAGTTALDKTNGNVRLVSRFMRHRDIKQTQRYDDNRTQPAGEIPDLISSETEED